MSIVSRLLERRPAPRPAGLVIEPMRRKHLRAVLAIERQVYPRPWSPGVFHSELDGVAAGERCYLVARDDGVLVGYAGMLYALDEAHVTNVAVDPARHRNGFGRRLLAELAWVAREHGSKHLSLEVRVSNNAAQELYRLFGFAPAGIRPKYYENTEDAIVMWRHDIDTPEFAAELRRLGA